MGPFHSIFSYRFVILTLQAFLLQYCFALYDPDTDRGIIILTNENFNSTVFHHTSPVGFDGKPLTGNLTWIIQFYNSWCGHCIRFAPVFKKTGIKTQHWNQFLRLGAVDCSYDYNRPLCARFHISSTPALRSFAPFSKDDIQGENMESQRTVTDNIYDILSIMEQSGIPEHLVALPEMSIENVWTTIPADITALTVIVESIGSSVAKECIMHLLPNLHVIMVKPAYSTNHQLLDSLTLGDQKTFPLVVFLERRLPGQRGVLSTWHFNIHHNAFVNECVICSSQPAER